MIGRLYLKDKTDKIVGSYTYDTLYTNDNLKSYLRYKIKDGWKLICGCRKDVDLEIRISVDGKIYKAENNTSDLHHELCPKSEVYENSKKEKKNKSGWDENEDNGEVNVTLDFSLYPYDESYRENNNNNNNSKAPKSYNHNSNINQSSISLLSLTAHLNLMAWNRVISRDNKIPDDRYMLLKQVYGSSKAININKKDKSLQDLIFNYSRDKNIKSSEARFIYGYLKDLYSYDMNGDYYIISLYTYDSKRAFDFKVKKTIFDNAKTYLKVGNKNKIAVAGFISKRRNGFTFFNLAMINVNDKGLYSESSYEIEFYDYLCNNNILFTKPYYRLLEYENHIPDGIINGKYKNIFIEVFGFNSEDYLKTRSEKIDIINNQLKDTHLLLKWDAYKKEDIPGIDYIKDLINKN